MSKRIIRELIDECSFIYCPYCSSVEPLYWAGGSCGECYAIVENVSDDDVDYDSEAIIRFIREENSAPASRIVMSILKWFGNPDEVIYNPEIVSEIVSEIVDNIFHPSYKDGEDYLLFKYNLNVGGIRTLSPYTPY